ncbi:MAG: NAD(+) synthase [Lachnospiraceae bacterium]|nr:NAD(+) synthase [Lachnospiraceae bacterium]
MFDAKKVKTECVEWIKAFFENNGKGCKAVVGISGGTDSSVVAALCAEALGKENVYGILMPQNEQPDIDYAYELCEFLGIKHSVINIGKTVEGMLELIEAELEDSISGLTKINLPPRIRMATLYAFSQSVNGRVANTCNLSEDWIGYSTRWGDSVGDFSPLANITKTEVRLLGKELGLPERLVLKAPSDGLTGKTDEENIGFSYEVLDRYIRTGEIEDDEIKAKIDDRHAKNLFKLKPIEAFPYK